MSEQLFAANTAVDFLGSQRRQQQHIAILMCTFNGEAHLGQQLASIEQQCFKYIDVWVSDDGSSDNTVAVLNDFKRSWTKGKFEILAGPQRGFAVNFMSLVCNDTIQADFYAYSDQDDVWELDKLSRAAYKIGINQQVPALYCSRTRLIAECGKSMRQKSPRFQKQPSFQNALVQSLAGGNTMVFNQPARQVLLRAGMQKIVSHDWWTYMLVAGAGGEIFYDPVPSVSYRQHSDNQIGANIGFIARIKRLGLLLKGSFSAWNTMHINSLNNVRSLLSPASQKALDDFVAARNGCVINRLVKLRRSGVYRQTTEGNIALWIAAILKKI